MKKDILQPTVGGFWAVLRCVIVWLIILSSNSASAQTLEKPTVSFEPSCGAGNIVLKATSTTIDENLIFIWYNEDLEVLGQEAGINGENEFITPFLTRNESFFVSLELNGMTSQVTEIEVQIIHTPKILEEPWIQLCGSAELHGSIELFDSFASITYQWQKLTASNETQVAFQDIEGETNIDLSVTGTGIFRLVVFLDDCMAISAGVEVTTEQIPVANPVGQGNHCYTVGSTEDDIASIISAHYRAGITTVAWYLSNDGGVTYSELISEERSASIEKPIAIIDTDETRYYRLVVSEQNCSDQTDFVINWSAKPRGSIRHKDESTDNFFYCEDDTNDSRTLEAISDDNVSVTWYRLLDIGLPKSQLELLSTSSGDDLSNFISLSELIGHGDEIVLDQSMGGLIFAEFTDLDNGCKDYSSNAMFADTAFPIPITIFDALPPFSTYPFSGVCLGLGTLTISSWDNTVDTYSWHYSTDNVDYDIVGASDSYDMNSINNPGDVEGFYKLGVEKNGCYAESDPFFIFESEYIESIIETTDTNFCQESAITLSSQNKSSSYEYQWFNTNDLSIELGSSENFTPTEAGSYVLELSNRFCTSVSDPVEIFEDEFVESIIEALDTQFCQESDIILSSQNQEAGYQYTWYNTNDLNNPLGASATFTPTEAGSYILELDNGSCKSTSEAIDITQSTFEEPIIEASNIQFCQESDIILSSQNQSSDYQYAWYNVDDMDNVLSDSVAYNPKEAGSYILEIDNGICVTTSNSTKIIQLPVPAANFSTPVDTEQVFCGEINAQLISENADDSYIWYQSTDSTNFSPIVGATILDHSISEAGYYFATVTNAVGCQANSDTIQIADIINGELNYDQVAYTCDGNNEVALWLKSAQENHTYQWLYSPDNIIDYTDASGDNNLAVYQTSALGYYKLKINGSICTLNTNEIEVQADPNQSEIEALILGNQEACSGTPITLTHVSDEPASLYTWFYKTINSELTTFDGEQQKSLTLDAADFTDDINPITEVEVYLGVKDGNCSSLSDPLAIQAIKKPVIILRNNITNTSEDVFVCDIRNEEVNLEAVQIPTSDRAIDYRWSVLNPELLSFDEIQSGDFESLNISEPGIYQCTGTIPGTSCAAVSNTLEISFLPHEISGDSTYCFGDTFEVQVGAGDMSNEAFEDFSYQWYYSDDNVFFTTIDTTHSSSLTFQSGDEGINGGYFYYIASNRSCRILSDTSFVREDEESVIISIDGASIQEKEIPFRLSASSDQTIDSIQWEPAQYALTPGGDYAVFTIPRDYPNDQIDITALVSSKSCTSKQHFLINLAELASFQFSKIITPDGDNHNDIFRVKGLNQSLPNTLQIFDAWGKMVYEKQDYDNSALQGDELIREIQSGNFYYVFLTGNQTFKGSFYVKN